MKFLIARLFIMFLNKDNKHDFRLYHDLKEWIDKKGKPEYDYAICECL